MVSESMVMVRRRVEVKFVGEEGLVQFVYVARLAMGRVQS